MRLTHILAAMALILLAGLLSVKGLEEHSGRASVPGIVLVEAPHLDPNTLVNLEGRWPGASLEWVKSGRAPLAPFVDTLPHRQDAGEALVLFADEAVDRAPDGSVAPWLAVVDAFPDLPSRPLTDWMFEAAARFVEARTGSRGYVLGLQLGAERLPDPAEAVEPLLAAARRAPSYRRTSLVLLGAHDENQPGHRWCLRIPVGDWSHRVRPGLADILVDTPY